MSRKLPPETDPHESSAYTCSSLAVICAVSCMCMTFVAVPREVLHLLIVARRVELYIFPLFSKEKPVWLPYKLSRMSRNLLYPKLLQVLFNPAPVQLLFVLNRHPMGQLYILDTFSKRFRSV